jgi:hypothetical protein
MRFFCDSCSSVDKSVPGFDAVIFLERNHARFGIKLDTVKIMGIPDSNRMIEFHFDSCKSHYSIFKMNRMSNINDSIMKSKLGKIRYYGADGLKKNDGHTRLSVTYGVLICHDSIVYKLTSKNAPDKGFETASRNLDFLKLFLTAENEIRATKYLDSLRFSCNSLTD